MGRINGANSDYIFSNAEGTVVENKAANPLFMKLYICPYNHPSTVEAASGTCSGSDQTCPNPVKTGHAMIQLDQASGIILQTDNQTKITIPQSGGPIDINGLQIVSSGNDKWLRLGNNGARIELKSNGDINLVPGGSGAVKINNVPIPV